MSGIPFADVFALLFFVVSWAVYHSLTELGFRNRLSLSKLMNIQRMAWMEEMSHREARITDSSLLGGLQSGTAFFASTSFIALGGSAALLRSTEDVTRILADLPLGLVPVRGLWELKILGLCGIFAYAFFKFAWAYRLYNYVAILIGATPSAHAPDDARRQHIVLQAGKMNIEAGRHFTRGQRAIFFSFAYLGWLVGPYVLVASTTAICFVIMRRQFYSRAHDAVALEDQGAGKKAAVLPVRR
jgi:uncharacterized membrane protein